jgi:hypothetical protein
MVPHLVPHPEVTRAENRLNGAEDMDAPTGPPLVGLVGMPIATIDAAAAKPIVILYNSEVAKEAYLRVDSCARQIKPICNSTRK